MKCALCGYQFAEDESAMACRGCPFRNCNMVRCPNGGFEVPVEPKLIQILKKMRRDNRGSE